ncbi:hypothetical protein VTL71DRAFT_5185 [Oculimacula yallundae]|uniref:BTB domain-containing protein n=1 Tax=Oculimacula yallundae TaxID=86028 RepID=A0ABR4C0J5_9HELO
MATSERLAKKAKLSLDSFQHQLCVIIGKSKTQVFVQKSMICHQSEFFKSACNPHWESGKSNTITLEEEDPVIFSLFLSWLYTGDIKQNEEYKSINGKATPTDASLKAHWLQLVQCFVLGEMLMASSFKNAVIDLLFSKTAVRYLRTSYVILIDVNIIEEIFVGTPQGSPLRRYILEACFHTLQADHALWAEMSTSTPTMRDFLEDMAKYSLETAQKFKGVKIKIKCPWEKRNSCEYHDHPGKMYNFNHKGATSKAFHMSHYSNGSGLIFGSPIPLFFSKRYYLWRDSHSSVFSGSFHTQVTLALI